MISRRSFVQSLAAAMATPTIGLAFTPTKPQIRWDLFTDDIAMRWDLSAPWVVNNSTFATDGRALISAIGCDGDTGEGRKVPSLHMLPWDDFDKAEWKSSRSLNRVATNSEDMVCTDCFGFGVIGARTKCKCGDMVVDEDGKPVLNHKEWIFSDVDAEDFGFDEPICRRCQNTGYIGNICQRCKGSGYVSDDVYRWQLDGMTFCPGLLGKFQTLGDFDCLLTTQSVDRKEQPLMLIRFDGGCGMLMGMYQ